MIALPDGRAFECVRVRQIVHASWLEIDAFEVLPNGSHDRIGITKRRETLEALDTAMKSAEIAADA